MRCVACTINENPPPPEDGTGAAFVLGLAFGARAPMVARGEVVESLCANHRRDLEEIGKASGESLVQLLTTFRTTYKATMNAPGERKLLVNTAHDHHIEFRGDR